MNVKHKNTKPLNWRKIISAGILVAVVAYAYGEPYLEKLTGWDLPSITNQNDSGNTATLEHPNERPNPGAPAAASIGSKSGGTTTNSSSTTGQDFLTPTGKKNRLQSPAGLVYGESRGEHRVDHVMRHAVDDENRPVHSVFDGSKQEILELIDEGYELVKSKSGRVRSKPDKERNYRVAHTIDMQRKIGYLGGRNGKRQNYPSRSKLTLVLDNEKFVITAYPDR